MLKQKIIIHSNDNEFQICAIIAECHGSIVGTSVTIMYSVNGGSPSTVTVLCYRPASPSMDPASFV